MSTIIYKDLAGHISTMPLKNVMFLTTKDGYNDEFDFPQLENDSSFKLTPIERLTSQGDIRTIGWNYEINLSILQNDLYDMQNVFEQIRQYCTELELDFGNAVPSGYNWEEGDFPDYINATDGMYVIIQPTQKPAITFEYETIELSIRAIIHIKGMIKQLTAQSNIIGMT